MKSTRRATAAATVLALRSRPLESGIGGRAKWRSPWIAGADQERVVGVAVAEVVAELDVGRDHRRARGQRVADRPVIPVGDGVDVVEDPELADEIPLDRQLVVGDDLAPCARPRGRARARRRARTGRLVGARDEARHDVVGRRHRDQQPRVVAQQARVAGGAELRVGRLDRALVLKRVELEARRGRRRRAAACAAAAAAGRPAPGRSSRTRRSRTPRAGCRPSRCARRSRRGRA